MRAPESGCPFCRSVILPATAAGLCAPIGAATARHVAAKAIQSEVRFKTVRVLPMRGFISWSRQKEIVHLAGCLKQPLPRILTRFRASAIIDDGTANELIRGSNAAHT